MIDDILKFDFSHLADPDLSGPYPSKMNSEAALLLQTSSQMARLKYIQGVASSWSLMMELAQPIGAVIQNQRLGTIYCFTDLY